MIIFPSTNLIKITPFFPALIANIPSTAVAVTIVGIAPKWLLVTPTHVVSIVLVRCCSRGGRIMWVMMTMKITT